jgi:predicted metal-dependent peptidase
MTKNAAENTLEENYETKEYKKIPGKDYSYIKQIISIFIVQEHFYGRIISRFSIKEDWNCQTAYVNFDLPFYKETGRITFNLGYNPEFIDAELCRKYEKDGYISNSSFEPAYKEVGFVLVHEILHTLLGHLTDRAYVSQDVFENHIMNIAMDLAINSLILKSTENKNKSISLIPPKVGFYPGRKPSIKDEEFAKFIENLPTLQTTTFYYNAIKEFLNNKNENGKDGNTGNQSNKVKVFLNGTSDSESGLSGFDSHAWESLPKEVREEIKSSIRNNVKEAMNQANKMNNWGTASEEIKELMNKIIAESPIDWTILLENAIGQCRIKEHESTYKKLSKKLPMFLPGEKKRTSTPIAFFIDQSGSMSDPEVQLAFAQAANCSKLIEVDVYNFDTEVDQSSHVIWKARSNFTWKRTRSGGTDFNSIKRFIENPSVKKRNWKWIVILTDGYAPELEPLPAKVLWLITPSGQEPQNVRPQDLVARMKFPDQYNNQEDIY